jgi:hypothetical protein
MTQAASTAAPTPVMDVVAPPIDKSEQRDQPVEQQPDPLEQLVADDRKSQQALTVAEGKPAEKTAKSTPKNHAAKHTETTHAKGVGLAIAATVLIVFGLAGLATYAYLQTNV